MSLKKPALAFRLGSSAYFQAEEGNRPGLIETGNPLFQEQPCRIGQIWRIALVLGALDFFKRVDKVFAYRQPMPMP